MADNLDLENNIVVDWDGMGLSRMQQYDEDGVFEYLALYIDSPVGKMVFPITKNKTGNPPGSLQVQLQTACNQFLKAITAIMEWDQTND